ncbi:uncharacterized protein LOC113240403 [Hyposmocoma kahamanoa]|uniref:uncharacterized protein LOC113240403 n=1 Tax=Hyposmocoma kahamanoa TaxID=1477025 RepID=UPI000E6D7F2E|nr:uncharacterized protein LOC113240403 [Hyposmocoma kahamanoa]
MEDTEDDIHDERQTKTIPGVISEKEFVHLLISLYRESPVLWDSRRTDYLDKTKRQTAQQDIVNALRVYRPEFTVDLLKKKINVLRTNFNKAVHKIQKSRKSVTSSDDAPPAPPENVIWYYHDMYFLVDVLKRDREQRDRDSTETEIVSPDPLVIIKKEKRKRRKIVTEDPPQSVVYPSTSSYVEIDGLDCDRVAKGWALKLYRLAADQRRYAEHIINDVLFEGAMGNLNQNGVYFLPNTGRESASPVAEYLTDSP